MTWFVLAILTAVFYGAQAAYLKGLTGELDQMLVTWSLFVFALPLFGVSLWVWGMPEVSSSFWLPFAVSLGINLVAWPTFVKSVRLSDISLVMPLLAFTPVFVLAIEYLLLGASPGRYGLAGILLIVVGAYVLNLREGASAALDPIRSLASDRGALLMLFVGAIWSISATVEKIIVTSSSPSFYMTSFGAMFAVCFLPVMRKFGAPSVEEFRRNWLILAGAGLLTGAMALAQMTAIKTTPLVNYVISIKRAGMLVSVLFGWLVFGEKNIFFRLVGAVVMIGGVGLIKLA